MKDKLYMKHRCSAICSLANFNIFMGMLFIPIALLLSGLILSLEFHFQCKEILGMILYKVQLNNDQNI